MSDKPTLDELAAKVTPENTHASVDDEWRWSQAQDERAARIGKVLVEQPKQVPVKVKRLSPDAKLPQYAHDTDSGFDLLSAADVTLEPGETAVIPTGLALQQPVGYEIQIRPRSGNSAKTKLRIANAPGTIDQYTGEIGVIIDNIAKWERLHIAKGHKVAQGVIAPVIHGTFTEVDALDETARGAGGFGSSGVRG
jgi:dUTP pyrophosphatase